MLRRWLSNFRKCLGANQQKCGSAEKHETRYCEKAGFDIRNIANVLVCKSTGLEK